MTNSTHNSFFLHVYFNSLHVSSNLVLITRRINCINRTFGIYTYVTLCRWPSSIQVGKELPDLYTRQSPTQSDIYQTLYWYNWFSWWWARGCSKHVENWNKHIRKENCASSWSFTIELYRDARSTKHKIFIIKIWNVWKAIFVIFSFQHL
jgi:hypothetical protein